MASQPQPIPENESVPEQETIPGQAGTPAARPQLAPQEVTLDDYLRATTQTATPTNTVEARALRWVAAQPLFRNAPTGRSLSLLVNQAIAEIDAKLTEAVNAIIHHPDFQQLESSWRGLEYMVREAKVEHGDRDAVVRILNCSWRELSRDIDRAGGEVEQTTLFRKIYDDEFGSPGGIPFGMLIGDYQITHQSSADHPYDDIAILQAVSQIAAASFAPFITGASPGLLGMKEFAQLDRQPDIAGLFRSSAYTRWNSLRRHPDSRFLGVTFPRVLIRLPYEDQYVSTTNYSCPDCGCALKNAQVTLCPGCNTALVQRRRSRVKKHSLGFRYREDVSDAEKAGKYLWTNAAYAFGVVCLRAFLDYGWLADIRGFDRNSDVGGLVTGLDAHSFGYDAAGVNPKMSTEVAIDDTQEKTLSELGLIPLSHCYNTDLSVFYSNRSVHIPQVYDSESATLNARISAMLQYTLCASRFAHYIKVIMRDLTGTLQEPVQIENRLRDWLYTYVTQDELASPETKAKYPLREADVKIIPDDSRPGAYMCEMRLWPHYQLDELVVSVKETTAVPSDMLRSG
jgi:type VI secretion system protein ImpD